MTRNNNRVLIQKYTNQPDQLPADVRRDIEKLWSGEDEILLYAMADLGPEMSLQRSWLILGKSTLAFARQNGAGSAELINVPRDQIKRVVENPGLSCTELRFLADGPSPALLSVRYSRRQQRAVENIRFVIEEDLKGQPVQPEDPDGAYAEAVGGPIRDAQASVTAHKLGVIWRLMSYLGPYKKQVIAGGAAAVALTVLNLVPPWLTGVIIDEVVKPVNEGSAAAAEMATQAWWLVGILLTIFVLREFFAWIRLRQLAMIGEDVAHDLRRQLYNHLQTLSLNFFSKKQTGSIISRVSSDTDRLWDFIAFGIVEVMLSAITLIGLGVVLVVMDWQLGLILTLPIPLFLLAYAWLGHNMNRLFLSAWRHWSNLTAVLSDTIPGMRVVKAFSQEEREKERFGNRNTIVLGSFKNVHKSWTTFWPFMMLSFHVLTVLVWAFALPRLLGTAQPNLTVGEFVAFLLYMGMFLVPLEIIGQMTRMMNRAISSAHRIFEILDTEPQITNITEPVRLERVEGRIEFENVSFSYDGIRRALKNVSFTIEPGEMVGLVGPSGSGKTTITNLLARFYEVTGGDVKVDGHDVRELDIASYRKQLGMVPQEAFLFHGTILENIRYGHHEADLSRVVEAARAANAHDFICKLAQGYETIVGERGHTLSGGERQRISIARAVLHDPRILILDEATSSVDTETERKIQEALDRLVAGRTTLAIAHRLSTLKRADRLLVMKDGSLVEEGTHSELLALDNGVYKKLHNLQLELSSTIGVG